MQRNSQNAQLNITTEDLKSSSKIMTHYDGKRKILNKSQAESSCCDHL